MATHRCKCQAADRFSLPPALHHTRPLSRWPAARSPHPDRPGTAAERTRDLRRPRWRERRMLGYMESKRSILTTHWPPLRERERHCDLFMNSRKTVIRFQMIGSVSKTQTLRAAYGYMDINRRVPSHSRKSHWREPSWQTLKHTNTRQLDRWIDG